MPTYLLCHRHDVTECPVAFAAWTGFESPLRGRPVLASCVIGDHRLWFVVETPDQAAATALLPGYLAARSQAIEVSEVTIP